jgi:hypothetical protein
MPNQLLTSATGDFKFDANHANIVRIKPPSMIARTMQAAWGMSSSSNAGVIGQLPRSFIMEMSPARYTEA